MMLFIALKFLAGRVFSILPGLAKSYLEHKQHQAIQGTQRMGIWAHAMVNAANADVQHREIAARERANSPALMVVYIFILCGPVAYYFIFWLDTIFADQVWTILGWTVWDWGAYDLPRAPDRLEEMGKWIIGIFIGGNTAVNGLVKGAKVLSAAGMFKGR